MNLEFVQMLRSIGEIEKDLHFRSKKYSIVDIEDPRARPSTDTIPVVVKHPDNIIVVASPTGKAPPPAVGEKRVTQLAAAIKMASISSIRGAKGCSIVVHEGMYIEPTAGFGDKMGKSFWVKDFSLEIIGVEEVRILHNCSSPVPLFEGQHFELALKNLSIYESIDHCTQGANAARYPSINVASTKLSFVHVRVHGPNLSVISHMSSEMKVLDCAFSLSQGSFDIQDSKGDVRRCQWYPKCKRGDETWNFCRPVAGCVNVNGSRVIFHQCRFTRQFGFDGETFGSALNVVRGGQAVLTESLVSGLCSAIIIKDSASKAVLNRCKILDCSIALPCYTNSSASVNECELSVAVAVVLQFNEKGKVKFRRNSLKPRKDFSHAYQAQDFPAVVITDREPKVLEHDFPHVQIRYIQQEEDPSGPCIGATRKSRQDFEEWCSLSQTTKFSGSWAPDVRHCIHCFKTEIEKPEAKFRYCERCRKVGYCSKECQVSHWRDHKLICRKARM